ncbi:ParA family protein [Pseudoalteromonas viridis]|uniref:AAA family ATPase n=1 Tax=Pseudoalteromonas viridis TaxID=339617 RepID=A0ABX7V549_9GAMM|nr:ParA family protein [Pseudoalteromonas viridis]QTL34936.1 AAA family ATPase [Pseudoalteromonas viridis]
MAVQIGLFNHKGGVSKTTTTFNLGWMLANKYKKVMLVDCDPQCNLTGMVLGFKGASKFKDIYENGGVTNIRDGLAPAFESRPAPIEPVDLQVVPGNRNLFLMPGHLGLAEYEVTLGIAQELSGSLVTLQNLPGSLNHLFNITAEKYDIDIILVDMSPSLGPINQNLLMTSDYFLVPMAPDYFSVMATESLSATLPKWHTWSQMAKQVPALKTASYPYPDKSPKFMGTIVQRYKLRKGDAPSAAFQDWIDDINTGVKNNLIPSLISCDMVLDTERYLSAGFAPEEPILQMSDFNGLIAQSQKYQAPVFDLSEEQLEQSGVVLDRTTSSMENFKRLYSDGADRILSIIENE